MGLPEHGQVGFLPPDTRAISNQPTSTAESASEELTGDTDEPPDEQQLDMTPRVSDLNKSSSNAQFKKAACSLQKRNSLLTRVLQSSESDSHVDEDDSPFFDATRVNSSASTASRGSVASIHELTGGGATRTSSSSPHLSPTKLKDLPPVFNQTPFDKPASTSVSSTGPIGATEKPLVKAANEQNVEAGLGRKRCITFACGGKEPPKPEQVVRSQTVTETAPADPPKRQCMLKFVCPTRDVAAPKARPHIRLASPPPRARRPLGSPKVSTRSHRGSDATVRDGSSPKAVRKSPSTLRARRDSQDSDATRSEATRFHEFASSEEEADDWIQESTCYSRPLTVDDTLSIELKLRKIGREVEEEEAEEDEEGEEVDEGAIDDEDSDEDDEEDEDEDDVLKQSVVSSGFDSDDGFQTDDEQGFAHSDDESEGSEYDWWAPRRTTGEQVEHIRPKPRRSDSESSTESFKGAEVFPGLQPGKRIRYKGSRPLDVQQPPELPDSTDFVCGTLDEDKPLEQAYMSALELRRAGKHKAVPQDIDPTFPTSDPELDDDDDEVDEVSEHDSIMDSDHPIFLHGHMEPHVDDERRPRGLIPKKRSPLHSPKRLRSPPPAKRISIHRSPPPMNRRAHSPRRIRSPAPFAFGRGRLSSSVPRNDRFKTRNRFHLPDEAVAEDTENTPRFLPERRAIDIVKGLEKKRERRHEKLLERHCRKGGKAKEKKHQPGKGAERMREMGLELNAYRGRKPVAPQGSEEVHMLSY